MGQFKSNQAIGCAQRSLKEFGFGEEPIKEKKVLFSEAHLIVDINTPVKPKHGKRAKPLTGQRSIMLRVPIGSKPTLSKIELSENDDEQLYDVN
jgi:hypothetical protein